MYQSYIFFLLDDGSIQRVGSPAYVSLVRDGAPMPEYAGKKVRMADLYVSLQDNRPHNIENETYSFLRFDSSGRAHPTHGAFAIEENHRFYDAALHSPYDDIDCDPEVRKVREKLGDEFSWLPTGKERETLAMLVFGRSAASQ